MKSQVYIGENRRSTALIRLLGIAAAAALLAVFWTAAGAAAQNTGTVTAEYAGWAADADSTTQAQISGSAFSITASAPGSNTADNPLGGWNCDDYRCHYLNVSWSGIASNPDGRFPYTITLTRNRNPSAADIGVSEANFETLVVATQMSLPTANTAQQYVPVPWHGEPVTVTVKGARYSAASAFAVKIPAHARSAAFTSRAVEFGLTLVNAAESSNLPRVMIAWPKLADATHFEVQYTFRTRSGQRAQRRTRSIYLQRQILLPGDSLTSYEPLQVDWSGHWNPAVRALIPSNFGNNGDWVGLLTYLPNMLAGAPAWPQVEGDDGYLRAVEANIVTALRAGKNAVGIRIRPLVVCADLDAATNHSSLCSAGSERTGALALRGKQSKISYVRFEGNNAAEWLSSARTPR